MPTPAAPHQEPTLDVSGTPLDVGDTVVTVNGQSTGKVIEIQREDDVHFVCLRPAHQSYGKGMWYASDQVFWVARSGGAKKADALAPAESAAVVTRSTPARKK